MSETVLKGRVEKNVKITYVLVSSGGCDDCENNIDNIYEKISAQKPLIEILLEEIRALGDELFSIAGVVYDFISNWLDLQAEYDGDLDKYYHAVANCNTSQRGVLADAVAGAAMDLREGNKFLID